MFNVNEKFQVQVTTKTRYAVFIVFSRIVKIKYPPLPKKQNAHEYFYNSLAESI